MAAAFRWYRPRARQCLQRYPANVAPRRGLTNLAMFNAAKRFARSNNASEQAKLAIVDGSGSYTYKQLLSDAQKVRLALGDKDYKGASVAMLMPNSYEYAAVQWGIWAAGGAVVPLSPMHAERELEYFITNSDSHTVVCHPSLLKNVQPVVDKLGGSVRVLESDAILQAPDLRDPDKDIVIDENQNALFIYTSGTTGKPKGVVHTHANIAAQVSSLHQAWGWSDRDRLLHVLPLHHVHGIVVALCSALWSGATTEMIPKFDKDRVWNRIADGPQDISILMGVPTMYARLLQAFDGMTSERQQIARKAMGRLRLTISGSAALPTSAGSVGKPMPLVGVRLIDADGRDVTSQPGASGMIQVRGPNVFSEYYGLPEKTAEEFTPDGWFITGDIGTCDPDGLYYIMGRQSVDIIKSGGYKLSALEIERELLEHPDIVDVAVVGIPSEEWGESVAAAVTLKPGSALPIDELKPWCYERMARYKVPQAVRAVNELPRNLMGKLDKKAVKALFN
ncbi:hypothetical protein GGI12_003502 [Dipsacomyces acuminosporus]|nr:hypothetical protein GGI12_003502 [Dipsacomyces acuminosporus]